MKILYLTFYFEPDLCAGSFRNTPLAKELSSLLDLKDRIHVVTTMPNRYNSFNEETISHEVTGNIEINRIKLPSHKSGLIDQSLAFIYYFFQTLKLTKSREYDIVFASSSRLFTAFLGSIISKRKKIPFYIDIRDIFVDTMNDVFKDKLLKYPILLFLKFIEKHTFKKAFHINLISEGFKSYFTKFKNTSFSYYTNGIDPEFLNFPISESMPNAEYIITYAGNIGEGQGLHKIIPEAAKLLGSKYKFRIIGDGGMKNELEEQLKNEKINNVEIIPPTNRKGLISYYHSTHFLFLHLNDYKAFKKVLPSKIFEYGSTDKPIIAGVSGFAAKFIENNLTNYIIFSPGDAKGFGQLLKNYAFEYTERLEFQKRFARSNINREMAKSIIKLGSQQF
ncbi:MAG: glycosyltransferase family 4 protein [Mariniphaga sp.]|nr:glycosyltransferase family 4 protein [Mariniphaga sp.]